MRISDWSSDVCSSDLPRGRPRRGPTRQHPGWQAPGSGWAHRPRTGAAPPVRRPGPDRPWRDRSPERTDDRSDAQTVGRVGRWATHEWTPPNTTSRTRPGGHDRPRLSQSSPDEDTPADTDRKIAV